MPSPLSLPLDLCVSLLELVEPGEQAAPFQRHQPGHSFNDLKGDQPSTAPMPPPAVLNTDLAPDTGAC